MDAKLPDTSVAEHLANKIAAIDAAKLPAGVRRTCEDLLVDVAGLCVTVRGADYINACLAGFDDDGPCTAIGHARTMTAAGAAFVNGTAAHGEDFDDTFEGGPVHAGAVIVPAVLAACERHNPDGRAALRGIAVGVETMCRLSTVAPTKTHKAGFHPTAIFGAMGAAAGVGAALGLNAKQLVDALGIAGSMASGIIEYLAEGAWTKRMHAGWAAQSGHARGAARACGLLWPAHGVRRRARAVPRLRQYARRQLRRSDRRFRHPLGHRNARLQALSLRDHGASLHRLRAPARGQGDRRTTSRTWSATSAKAPCTGCGSRSPPSRRRPTAIPASSPRPTASPPASCAAMSGLAISPTKRCAIRRW